MSWLSTGEAPEFAEEANFDENGDLVVKKIKAEEIETQKGISTYDTTTGEPYCVRVTDGVAVTVSGKCGENETPSH